MSLLSMPPISSAPLGRVSPVSATFTDCLLAPNGYSYSLCGSFLLHQWNHGALRSRSSLCPRNMSSSCPFGVLRMENLVACHEVNRLGRWRADCYYHRVALCQSGIRCKEVFPCQTVANLKFRTSATGATSVQKEEETAGESAAPAEGSSGGKIKASGQLARWARARKIRAGKLATVQKKNESIASVAVQEAPESAQVLERESGTEAIDEGEEVEDYSSLPPLEGYEKCVYMVSDGTGWTADHSVHAALGQFEHCMVDRRCSVNTHLFSDVNDEDRLLQIIRQAGHEAGMIVFTLADPAMAAVAKQACELLRIPHIDILGPITVSLANHLGVSPLGLPRGAPGRKTTLSKQYFKRIEAVEFTIKQDDGALPKNLSLADLVLVGVSRTSKTPLSTYIAQKGYKVANVPLVFGIDPPKELFEVNQDKVFGLTINANFLKAIRLARYRHLGVAEDSRSSYSDMEHIKRELEYSRKLFSQNPRWPVVEVTGKAIEETAAVILRLYHERRNKYSMPRISTRY